MPAQPLPLKAFGDLLRATRTQRELSVRQLENASGVSFSLISALENYRRSAGMATVEKLADALSLRGGERDRFIALGNDISCRHRLQVGEKRKGMQLLRKLVGAIAGIREEEIEDIILEYRPPSAAVVYDFVIRLHDKRLFAGEIKGDEILIIPADPKTGLLPDPRRARQSPNTRIIDIRQ